MADNNGNGEKYWSRTIIPILLGALFTVVGLLWGLTYGGMNNRICKLETQFADQKLLQKEMDTKLNLLLDDRGIKYDSRSSKRESYEGGKK